MITKQESKNLNYEDYQDFLDAAEGFIKEPLWYDKDNETEQEFKDRVKERIELCPACVNKSLWRQALLNNMHGLYRVCDSI